MADKYDPVSPQEGDDFDVNFSGSTMRRILEDSGLADTDITQVMNKVRLAQQMKMVLHETEGRNLAKSTTDFHFVVTVNQNQIREVLHDSDVSQKAVVKSLTAFNGMAKEVASAQARSGQKARVKNTIYWAVNYGRCDYYPPSSPDHHRLLLHSNDKDAIPTEITATGFYPHVVVITKHWQTALHILNKLKHTEVRIIYVEFIILSSPMEPDRFTASCLVQDCHAVHEWSEFQENSLERAIEKHIGVDRTYPKTRGVRGINMYPTAQAGYNRAPAGSDSRHFSEPQAKRRPLLDNPPTETYSREYPRENGYDSRDYHDREKSPKKERGRLDDYGYVNEPEEERYSYDDYTKSREHRNDNPVGMDAYGYGTESRNDRPAGMDAYGYGTHSVPPLRHSTPIRDGADFHSSGYEYFAQKVASYVGPTHNNNDPPAYSSSSGMFPSYGGFEQAKKRPMPDYKIPKKKAPGAMGLL